MAKIYGVTKERVRDHDNEDYSEVPEENDYLGESVNVDDNPKGYGVATPAQTSMGYGEEADTIINNDPLQGTREAKIDREPSAAMQDNESGSTGYTPRKGKLDPSGKLPSLMSDEELNERDKALGGKGDLGKKTEPESSPPPKKEPESSPPPKDSGGSGGGAIAKDHGKETAYTKGMSDIADATLKVEEAKVKSLIESEKIKADLDKKQAALSKELVAHHNTRMSVLQKTKDDAYKERNKYQELASKYAMKLLNSPEAKINPERFMGEGITGRKIFAFVSLFLAGMGGPGYLNAAMRNINGAIDRDISAQKANRNINFKKYQVATNMLGHIDNAYGKNVDSESAISAAYLDMAKMRLEVLSRTASTDIRRQNIESLKVALDEAKIARQKLGLANFKYPQGRVNPQLVREDERRERVVEYTPTFGFFSKGKDAHKEANKTLTKYRPYLKAFNDVINFAKENKGFAGTGKIFFPNWPSASRKKAKSIMANLIMKAKTKEGMGANFTDVEIKLLGDFFGISVENGKITEGVGQWYFGDDKWKMFQQLYERELSNMWTDLSLYIKVDPLTYNIGTFKTDLSENGWGKGKTK